VTTLTSGDVTQGKMTLGVRKMYANEVPQMLFASHIGSMKVDGKLNVPPKTCIVAKVLCSVFLYNK